MVVGTFSGEGKNGIFGGGMWYNVGDATLAVLKAVRFK